MNSRSLLVYLPGYPVSLEPLFPRQRLASLGGALLAAGHDVRIADFGGLDFLARLYPRDCAESALSLADRLADGDAATPRGVLGLRWSARSLRRSIRLRQRRAWSDAATELADQGPYRSVIFEIHSIDDLAACDGAARALRRAWPAARVAAAGQFAERHPRYVLHHAEAVDAVLGGDAEAAAVRWLATPPGRPVVVGGGGLVLRGDGGGRNAAAEPGAYSEPGAFFEPIYAPDVYGALEGDAKLKLFTIEDCRGAPAAAPHCGALAREGLPLHLKSPAAVRREAQALASLYGVDFFLLAGHAAPLTHVLGVARAFEAAPWMRYGRRVALGHAVPAMFAPLHRSGCRIIEGRLDSGSQRLLDRVYGAALEVSPAEAALRAASAQGLMAVAGLVFPGWLDDRHTVEETMRCIARTRPSGCTFTLPEVAEGSEWGRRMREWGMPAACRVPPLSEFPFTPERLRLPRGRISGYGPNAAAAALESLAGRAAELGTAPRVDLRGAALALALERETDAAVFEWRLQRSLMAGDFEAVGDLARRFNRAASSAGRMAQYRTEGPLRNAVGD